MKMSDCIFRDCITEEDDSLGCFVPTHVQVSCSWGSGSLARTLYSTPIDGRISSQDQKIEVFEKLVSSLVIDSNIIKNALAHKYF